MLGALLRVVSVTGAATFALAARAEATSTSRCTKYPNAIVADVGLHVVNAGYQRTIDCYLVLQTSAGLYVPWTVNANVFGLGGGDRPPPGIWDVAGFVVRARPFFFPAGTAPTGFWMSPFLQAGFVRGAAATTNLNGFAAAEGASLGGTFRLGSRILIALGAGAQLHVAWFRGNTDPPGFALPGPTVDINAAYAF